jgi:hypothetical protein
MDNIVLGYVRRSLRFDSNEGKFYWVSPPKQHPRLIGQEAGCACENGSGKFYWHIKINGKAYKRGHLVFLLKNKRMPKPLLDHVDGNSLNDKASNLREATVLQNAWNHKRRKRRINLPMGVRKNPSGTFAARIAVRGELKTIGTFPTPEKASDAYQSARRRYYGEFA